MTARQLLGLWAIGAAPALLYTVPAVGVRGIVQAAGMGLIPAVIGAVQHKLMAPQTDSRNQLRATQMTTLGVALFLTFGLWYSSR